MSTISMAREWLDYWSPVVNNWRGLAQEAMIGYRISAETGCDSLAVASDKRLIECGWAQAPLEVAYKRGADPFHPLTAVWLACWMEHRAAVRWVTKYPGLRARSRDLVYVAALDYSVGGRAVGRLLYLAEMHGSADESYEARIRWVGKNCDLAKPSNAVYWPRQGADRIKMRIEKKAAWCDAAAQVGPLDEAPHYPPPPDSLPADCMPFPPSLTRAARTVSNPNATSDECAAAWRIVREYARERRALGRAAKPPVLYRAGKVLRALLWGTDRASED